MDKTVIPLPPYLVFSLPEMLLAGTAAFPVGSIVHAHVASSRPCDGTPIALADWPELQELVEAHTERRVPYPRWWRRKARRIWLARARWPYGDDRTDQEVIDAVPPRLVNLPDLRGRVVSAEAA